VTCDFRSSLFRGATESRLVVVYRRFGTSRRYLLQGYFLNLEDGTDKLPRNRLVVTDVSGHTVGPSYKRDSLTLKDGTDRLSRNRLVFTDVSGHTVGSIFQGDSLNLEDDTNSLSRRSINIGLRCVTSQKNQDPARFRFMAPFTCGKTGISCPPRIWCQDQSPCS